MKQIPQGHIRSTLFLLLITALLIIGCDGRPDVPADSSRLEASKWEEHDASPILLPGPPGSWYEKRADTGNSIVAVKNSWYLYHSGEDADSVSRIGLHVSPKDSISGTWRPVRNKPLLVPGSAGAWDSLFVAHPAVLRHKGVFWMYYTGTDGRSRRIGLARSGNGIEWKKTPGPVLSPGPQGEWDAGGVMHPSVIHDGERFVMAYCGWQEGRSEIHSQVGIAVSTDGLKWSKLSAGPVLGFGEEGQWDEIGLLAPRMWMDNSRYYLNYSGKEARSAMSSLGHATAETPERWIKSAQNPMLHHLDVRYHEIEWATPVWFQRRWYLLATAHFDRGVTTLWREVLR